MYIYIYTCIYYIYIYIFKFIFFYLHIDRYPNVGNVFNFSTACGNGTAPAPGAPLDSMSLQGVYP